MHIGNLRTALYAYLIAKHAGGKFILRIEDTDQNRLVEGSTEVIFSTLRVAGLKYDEGPGVGGEFGPYVQSERKNDYMLYAKELVEKGAAYYCFCTKERLDALEGAGGFAKYDRHCLRLSKEEIAAKLAGGEPFVIRQKIPDGETTFHDEVYGSITVKNDELEDQVLIKSDGLPTYNFANVVDDHLMRITHVIRGSEYLSSTPKYNLLYGAFGWEIPTYIHLPLILNSSGEKLSKRKGDASFEDLLTQGFLPEAVVNYIALLGWSPSDNREFFTLEELAEAFDTKGISKSPSVFDTAKLTWMNGEYFKKMDAEKFYEMALPELKKCVSEGHDYKKLAGMVQPRIEFLSNIAELLDFIDALPAYSAELYTHKKMKTDAAVSLASLTAAETLLRNAPDWSEQALHETILVKVEELGIKNGQMLWPIRTALSGKPTSPCGATELLVLLGKEESLRRLEMAVVKLDAAG